MPASPGATFFSTCPCFWAVSSSSGYYSSSFLAPSGPPMIPTSPPSPSFPILIASWGKWCRPPFPFQPISLRHRQLGQRFAQSHLAWSASNLSGRRVHHLRGGSYSAHSWAAWPVGSPDAGPIRPLPPSSPLSPHYPSYLAVTFSSMPWISVMVCPFSW